eukprot:s243_g2.t1
MHDNVENDDGDDDDEDDDDGDGDGDGDGDDGDDDDDDDADDDVEEHAVEKNDIEDDDVHDHNVGDDEVEDDDVEEDDDEDDNAEDEAEDDKVEGYDDVPRFQIQEVHAVLKPLLCGKTGDVDGIITFLFLGLRHHMSNLENSRLAFLKRCSSDPNAFDVSSPPRTAHPVTLVTPNGILFDPKNGSLDLWSLSLTAKRQLHISPWTRSRVPNLRPGSQDVVGSLFSGHDFPLEVVAKHQPVFIAGSSMVLCNGPYLAQIHSI